MFKQVDASEIKSKDYASSVAKKDIQDFLDSEMQTAELIVPEDSTYASLCSTYRFTAKKYNLPVKFIMRKPRLFMVKT